MRRLLLELKIAGINFPLVTAALSLALVLFAALAGELLDFAPIAFEVVFPLYAAIAVGEWARFRSDTAFEAIAAQSGPSLHNPLTQTGESVVYYFYQQAAGWYQLNSWQLRTARDCNRVFFRFLQEEQRRSSPQTDQEHNLVFHKALALAQAACQQRKPARDLPRTT